MTNPACPSCNAALPKMPQRKTKCKACGQFMFVKRTPDDRTPRLMSESEAMAADTLWENYAAQQNGRRVSSFARQLGVGADEIARAERATNLDAQRLMQALIAPRALQGDRDALWFMWAYANGARAWHLSLVQLDLDIMRDSGYRSARIRAEPPTHAPCARCASSNGRLVLTTDPAIQFVPSDCGFAHCHISISPNLQERPNPPANRTLRPHQERMLRAAEQSGGLFFRFPVPLQN